MNGKNGSKFGRVAVAVATLVGTVGLMACSGRAAPGSGHLDMTTKGVNVAATYAPPAASYRGSLTSARHYRGREHLLPPPAGASPAKTWQDAYATCKPASGTGSVCSQSSGPVIELTQFTDDEYGDIQPDGSSRPRFQNVLAYVMTWHNQPCMMAGPVARKAADPNNCDLMNFVDASTGQYMVAIVTNAAATQR